MSLLRLAARNLRRNRRRTGLTVGSVALVILLVVLLATLLDALARDDSGARGASRIAVQHAAGPTNLLPLAYRKDLEAIPGVVAVTPALWFAGTYRDGRSENHFNQAAVDPRTWPVVFDDFAIDPAEIAAWRSERDAFIASPQLIARFGWRLGDRIRITGSYLPVDLDLVLRGVFQAHDTSYIAFHASYLESGAAGRWGQTGIFIVRVADPAAVPGVAAAVERAFENSAPPVKAMPMKQFKLQFLELFGNVRLLVRSVALFIVVTVVLIVANTIAMAARERVTEVAVMRALGFRPDEVLWLAWSEALVVAAIGGVLGVGLAWPVTALIVTAMEGSPMAMLAHKVQLTVPTLLAGFGIAVAVGAIAGFVPALRSARIRIVDGLRQVV